MKTKNTAFFLVLFCASVSLHAQVTTQVAPPAAPQQKIVADDHSGISTCGVPVIEQEATSTECCPDADDLAVYSFSRYSTNILKKPLFALSSGRSGGTSFPVTQSHSFDVPASLFAGSRFLV